MRNNEYILYLDMDGVLVDLKRGRTPFSKIDPATRDKNPNFIKDYLNFWSDRAWIRGGQELFAASIALFEDVRILSSAGPGTEERHKIVEAGKRLWIKNNAPAIDQSKVFIVPGKEKKQEYAAKNAILVDDVSVTIKQWNAAGGYGILHDSRFYKDTIEDLKDIISPLNLTEILKRLK